VKKILIADDEENLRILIETTLEGPDCVMVHASEGVAALAMAIQENPDLIILDWMMPGMSGIEVLKALRDYDSTRKAPIVMLTARGQENDRALAIALGASCYLVKPFSPLELLEKVQEALAIDAGANGSEDNLGTNGSQKRLARSA
jgi:two-component system phosphate regulon response regulator PhoB